MAPVRMSLGVVNVLLACGWGFSSRSAAYYHNDNNGIRTRIHINNTKRLQHTSATSAPPTCHTMTQACLHTTSNKRSTTTTAKCSPCPPNTRSTTTTTTKRRQQQEGYNTHNNDETTSTTRGQSHPRHQNQHTDVAPPTISDRPQKPFRGKEER